MSFLDCVSGSYSCLIFSAHLSPSCSSTSVKIRCSFLYLLVNMPGTCIFQELWLQNDEFKDWVLKVDDRLVKCKVCKTIANLSHMEEEDLHSHAKDKKHAACMKPTEAASTYHCST